MGAMDGCPKTGINILAPELLTQVSNLLARRRSSQGPHLRASPAALRLIFDECGDFLHHLGPAPVAATTFSSGIFRPMQGPQHDR
jgi:hypothetical protein